MVEGHVLVTLFRKPLKGHFSSDTCVTVPGLSAASHHDCMATALRGDCHLDCQISGSIPRANSRDEVTVTLAHLQRLSTNSGDLHLRQLLV